MIKNLPAEYAILPNDSAVPADRAFVLHRPKEGRLDRAQCGTAVAPVPLVTMVAHGTGTCATCFGAASGSKPGQKGG